MPIVPPEIWSIRPSYLTKCRPARVRASGWSSAFAPTVSAAHREAAVAARRVRDRAVQDVQAMRCPPKGGCAAGCRKGRTLKIGYGMRRSAGRKIGNGWLVSVTAYYIFLVNCHCPE